MVGLNNLCSLFKLGITAASTTLVMVFCLPTCASDVNHELDSRLGIKERELGKSDLENTELARVSSAFSNPLNPQPTVYTDKTSVVIPLNSRYGFEYVRTDDERYSNDWVEVSFVTALEQDYFGNNSDRYSMSSPLVLKVTLKGYSLFQSQEGEGEFFSFDRAKEREIREPQFLLSVSKNF